MIQNDFIPAKTIRQIILLVIVIGLGYLLYKELHFMFGAFLGSIALYMLMRKSMFKLVYQRKWKKSLAAALLLVVSLVVIVLPLAWVVNTLVAELAPIVTDTAKIEQAINSIHDYLEKNYKFDILSKENVQKLPGIITGLGSSVVSHTLNTLTNIVIMYFLLWFMLVNGGDMERWIRASLPLKNTNVSKLMKETHDVVLSNTIGIPVLGAVQGIIAIIGYYMFEVEKPILWGIITGITSVIPFVGTMAAWVPITIFSFAKGDTTNGYWLMFWGFFIIGGSDNIFRFILQKYLADIHPIITVFGVIIGLSLFGFLGLIFGPLIISLFLLLVRIYYDEFVNTPEPPLIEEKASPREGD
jgi:predicted PurR-regulated permease PerM